jgi:hypothetical protein
MTATRPLRGALVAAAIGIAGCAVGLAVAREQVLVSWLAAWWFVLGIALGSLVITMVHRLTGGAWGTVVAPPLAAAALTTPLVAVLAIPLFFATSTLFAWTHPDASLAALVEAKAWYLNLPFLGVRTAIYLAIWVAIAVGLAHDLRNGFVSADAVDARLRRRSIVALLAYAVTLTFASIDWLMSLTPQWYSTTFGLLAMLGQTLSAFAFCVACASLVPATAGRAATERDWQDMGNLLLMFAMTWAYLAFTQFLIVWAEDLPHEIHWYVLRRTAGWEAVAVALAAVRFGLPLVAMLFRPLKRNRLILGSVCAAVVAAGWLDVAWLVAPSFRQGRFPLHWTDAAAALAVIGIWLAGFIVALAWIRVPRARLSHA